MLARWRATTLAVFCAYVAFIVAGLGFQKMTEYEDFTAAARAHAVVGAAFDVVVVFSVVALVAMVVAGLPVVLAAGRSALGQRRNDVLALLAVPPVALAVLVTAAWLAGRTAGQGVHGATATGVFVGWVAVLAATAVGSTWAVCRAVTRAAVDVRLWRFAGATGAVTTAAMAVMLVATVVWGLGLRAADPRLFHGGDGVVGTPTAATWAAIVLVMAGATTVAAGAVWRGWRAARAG